MRACPMITICVCDDARVGWGTVRNPIALDSAAVVYFGTDNGNLLGLVPFGAFMFAIVLCAASVC
jgi:hypothetical protein